MLFGGALRQYSSKASAENVKRMRAVVELPIGLIRKALMESGDNVDAAFEWLKNNEEARAKMARTKLSGREASQGIISLQRCLKSAVLVELRCETDFVARNEKFQALVNDIGRVCHQYVASGKCSETSANPGKVATLPMEVVTDLQVDGSRKVGQAVDATLAAIGENISLTRVAAVSVPHGVVGGYTHNNGTYGALVAAEASSSSNEALQALAKSLDQIAQHIVAIDPAEGDGAANPLKHLLTQPYVLDSKLTVGAKLEKDAGAAKVNNVKLTDYIRWQR